MTAKKELCNQGHLNAVDTIEQFWLRLLHEETKNIVKFTNFKMPRSNLITNQSERLINKQFNQITGGSSHVSLQDLEELGKSTKNLLSNWIKGGGPEYEALVKHAEFIDAASKNLKNKKRLSYVEFKQLLSEYEVFLGFKISQFENAEDEINSSDLFVGLIYIYLICLISFIDSVVSVCIYRLSAKTSSCPEPVCLYTVFSKQLHPNTYIKEDGKFIFKSYRHKSAGRYTYPTQNLFDYLSALSRLGQSDFSLKLYGSKDFTQANDPTGSKLNFIKRYRENKLTVSYLDLFWLLAVEGENADNLTKKLIELNRSDFYSQFFKIAQDLGEDISLKKQKIAQFDKRFTNWNHISDHSLLYMIWLVYRFKVLCEASLDKDEPETTSFYQNIWRSYIDKHLPDTSSVNIEWPIEIQVLAQPDLPLSK